MLVKATGYDIIGLSCEDYGLILHALQTQRMYSQSEGQAVHARVLRDKLSAVEEG